MNKNIFLKTENNNENIDKYNPDVIKNFKMLEKVINNFPVGKFVDSYYKSVTNQPIKGNIRSSKELQLEKDKPDMKKLCSDYDTRLFQMMQEKAIVQKSIEKYKKENGIVEKSYDEMNKEYQIELQKQDEVKIQRKLQLKQQTNINDKKEELQIKTHQQIKKENENLDTDEVKYDKIINIVTQQIIPDDEEIIDTHIDFKNNHKMYILNDNDKLLKEKQKYNDLLKVLEDIL
jgi:hypothetical protein